MKEADRPEAIALPAASPLGAVVVDKARCTLCLSCVSACPTGARHFGDLGDPSSAVSQLVKEREGFDLLPEMGFKPVNKYLPPRPRRDQTAAASAQAPAEQPAAGTGSLADRFFAWADRALSR